MLWVYSYHKNISNAGIVFIRQNLTYKDSPHAERVNFFIAETLVAIYMLAMVQMFCCIRLTVK